MAVKGFQLEITAKNPCRVATTANVATLAGAAPDPVDGVSLAAGDRVLVKDQSTGAENGIYVVGTVGTGSDGTWTRALDMDNVADDQIEAGLSVYVQEGLVNTKKTFVLTTTGAIILDTTSLAFTDNGTSGTSASGTITTQNSGNITSQSAVGANTRMFILNRNGAAIKTLQLPLAASVTTTWHLAFGALLILPW